MEGLEKNIAIVLSAGRGKRMNASIPKQYLDLCGRPVLFWSLRAFQDDPEIEEVILVASREDLSFCREKIVEEYQLSKVRRIVEGGRERCLSVFSGLKEMEKIGDVSYVFIHDGARPLLDGEMLRRLHGAVRAYGACVAAMPVKDTIKIGDGESFAISTPDRRKLWQVQTPQVFQADLVLDSYRKIVFRGELDVTDDAMVVERACGTKVKLVEGSYRNLKITTPEDLLIAGALMREKENA